MKTITDLVLVAFITIYIVDISGFTQSWRALVAKLLGVSEDALRPLPPFDCSLCMVWWVSLVYLLVTGTFTLPWIALAALLSMMAFPFGQMLVLVRESILKLVNLLMDLL